MFLAELEVDSLIRVMDERLVGYVFLESREVAEKSQNGPNVCNTLVCLLSYV